MYLVVISIINLDFFMSFNLILFDLYLLNYHFNNLMMNILFHSFFMLKTFYLNVIYFLYLEKTFIIFYLILNLDQI
jgi:hypothetical protein